MKHNKTFEITLRCSKCHIVTHSQKLVPDHLVLKYMLKPEFQALKCPMGCSPPHEFAGITEILLKEED